MYHGMLPSIRLLCVCCHGYNRDFLNTVTTDIIHLHDNRLHQYKGNFAQFEEMYDQRRREVSGANPRGEMGKTGERMLTFAGVDN